MVNDGLDVTITNVPPDRDGVPVDRYDGISIPLTAGQPRPIIHRGVGLLYHGTLDRQARLWRHQREPGGRS
jgi:hypothetical protein